MLSQRLPRYMARRRVTWIAWLLLWFPVILVAFLLTVVVETLRTWYATWNWQWRGWWAAWFHSFTEQHRKAQFSLALKPQPGGVLLSRARVRGSHQLTGPLS